jgi:hypothetical protein
MHHLMIIVSSAASAAEDKPVAVAATLFGERKAPDGTPLGH